MQKNSVNYWINILKLDKHPEGGWYKEIYRSDMVIDKKCFNGKYSGDRNSMTSIYYLLKKNEFSAFHKIKSDEIWHYYDGAPLILYTINENGELNKYILGTDKNCLPQVIIPANTWFGATTSGDYTLMGCTVSPGFDFEDFELASRKVLSEQFPQHSEIIRKLTR